MGFETDLLEAAVNTRKISAFLFRVHAWLGLHLFLAMTFMFATGTLLVFAPEIVATFDSRMRAPAPTSTHQATYGQIFDAVQQEFPRDGIYRIQRSSISWIGDRTTTVTVDGQENIVWTNPENGQVLGVTLELGLAKLWRNLHDHLLIEGRPPRVLWLSLSLFLLISLATGLVTYREFWRWLFRPPPRRSGARAWWIGVHRLIALWVFPFLLISAISGVYFLTSAAGFGAKHPKPPPASERTDRLPAGFNGNAIEQAAGVARSAFPELEILEVKLPGSRRKGVTFLGQARAKFVRPRGNAITIDPVTMEVLALFRGEDLGLHPRIRELAETLHFGIWGGLPIRILWFFFGLLATFLTISGSLVYVARIRGANTAKPSTSPHSSWLREIWRGMSLLKWGYVVVVVAIVVNLAL